MSIQRNLEEMDRAFEDACEHGAGYLRVTMLNGQRILTCIDPRRVVLDPSREEVNAALNEEVAKWKNS